MKAMLLSLLLLAGVYTAATAQPQATVYVCPPCGSTCDTLHFSAAGTCPHCGMSLTPSNTMNHPINVAVFLFNGLELLDFAGPGEVFATTPGFRVYTVAVDKTAVTCQGFVQVTPNFSIADAPSPDIIVIPGGDVDEPMNNAALLNWINRYAKDSAIVLSVCTGAGVLSKAGLLDGKTATTFHNYIHTLQRITPKAQVLSGKRFVDNGQVITTAGISAGIDGALHLVARLKGDEVAQRTAAHMEYDKWKPGEGMVVKH